MKTTISGAWIMQLVIIFVLIFVCFITFTIALTRAHAYKNTLISVIEKYQGYNSSSITIINNYLSNQGYSQQGVCYLDDTDIQTIYGTAVTIYGVQSLDSGTFEVAQQGTKYYYCITEVNSSTTAHSDRTYYDVKVFFKMNLPVIGDLVTMNANGRTVDIDYAVS